MRASAAAQVVHDRAREQPVQQQELGGVGVGRHTAVRADERVVSATAAQHVAPGALWMLPDVTWARGDQPGGHVHPLEAAAEGEEQPPLVMAHRLVGRAGDDRATLPDVPERGRGSHPLQPAALDRVPRGVDRLPHLAGDGLPRPPGRLARAAERRGNRCTARSGRSTATRSTSLVSADSPAPAPPSPRAGVQRGVVLVDRDGSSSSNWRCTSTIRWCPPPAPDSDRSRTATPRSGSARLATVRSGSAAAAAPAAAPSPRRGRRGERRPPCLARTPTPAMGRGRRPAASTQVSFDPPPWLEFTISSPSGSATRVSPPGST